MNGLLIKDILILRKSLGTRIMEILTITIILMIWKGEGMIYSSLLIFPILSTMPPFYLIALDNQWKWDKYAIALPVLKQKIVFSKYALFFAISLFYFVVSLIFNIVSFYWFQDYPISIHLTVAFVGFGISVFLLSVLLPASVLGIEKTAWAIIGFLFIAIISGVILNRMDLNFLAISPTFQQVMIIALIGISLLIGLSIISYLISVTFYRKKYS